jgi:hypothetical protein
LNGKTIDSTDDIYSKNWECDCVPKTGTNPSIITVKSLQLNDFWNFTGTNTLTVVNNTPGYNMISGYSATINYIARVNSFSSNWLPSVGLNNPDIYNPIAKPIVTTDYIVSIIDANGCSNVSAPKTVIVYPSPQIEAGPNQTVCIGNSAILAANGGTNYSWNNGVEQGIPFIPTYTATYKVTGTGDNGCIAVDSVTVTVNPLPQAEAGENQTVCYGQNITLIANGGLEYIWSDGIQQGISFIPINTSTYKVTVGESGCFAIDSVTVTVNPLPQANAGNDQTVNSGSSVTLTASGGINYIWSDGIQQGIPFVPTNTNAYIVTVIDANGCSDADTVLVIVNPIQVIGVTPGSEDQGNNCGDSNTIFIGYGHQCVTLTVPEIAAHYLWNTGATSSSISVCPTIKTTYTVTMVKSNGNSDIGLVVMNVIDIRCDDKGKKVYICHRPPGNPENEQTECVSTSAVPAHLRNHGDCLGPCHERANNSANGVTENNNDFGTIELFPNPNAGKFTVMCKAKNTDLPIEVIVYNIIGKEIKRTVLKQENGIYKLDIDISDINGKIIMGLYVVRISNGNNTMVRKVSVIN